MSTRLLCLPLVFAVLATYVVADDAKKEAVRKDRELLAGTWRVVALEAGGTKVDDEAAKKLTVVNGADASWVLSIDGQVVAKGTNAIDPTRTPKAIDFTVTEGPKVGNTYAGIYELGKDSRRLCYAPAGKARPTEFKTTQDNQCVLVTFKREK